MDIKIYASKLRGSVTPPFSKSYALRLLLCSSLAGIRGGLPMEGFCDDVVTMQEVLKSEGTFNCRDSGATLRFILPVCAALGMAANIEGSAQLSARPLKELMDILIEHGAYMEGSRLPLTIDGKLRAGRYEIAGNVSSQYISGLLMALPLLEGDSRLALSSPLESRAYVDMTLDVMKKYSVAAEETEEGWNIPGQQRYVYNGPAELERDWSGAAFWYAANTLGCQISVEGMNESSLQPDSAIRQALSRLGSTISVKECPDIAPVLAIAASGIEGVTVLAEGSRLKFKESDRLQGTAELVNSLGGKAAVSGDSIVIMGAGKLKGGAVDARGDHRRAMSAAVASLICEEAVIIKGAECVSKSYPEFFRHFAELGGKWEEISL